MLDILTETEQNILKLQVKLSQTDYIAIKYAEGELNENEYAPIKAQRRAWRLEIKNLRDYLEHLKNSQA